MINYLVQRIRPTLIFAAIIILAFAVKLPFSVQQFRLLPDAIAYLNIARNLASGNGFTSTIKLNYFDSSPVTHNALSDWPPLYPFFAGVILKLGMGEIGLQIVNAFLAAIAAGIVFLLGNALFDRRTGVIAGVFAAFSPILFRAGIVALSDALGLTLALSAVVLALRKDNRPIHWIIAGALVGAAYLARYPNAVLIIALAAYLIKTRNRNAFVWLTSGVALISGPVLVLKWILLGSPFYSAQIMHYTGSSFESMCRQESGGFDPLYAIHHLYRIAPLVIGHTLFYAADLLAGFRGLFLLSIGLLTLPRKAISDRHRMVVLVAVLNFAVYALTWSIPPIRGSRFMLLSYTLLLPFCTAGLIRAFESGILLRRATIMVCVGVCIAYLWGIKMSAVNTQYQFNRQAVQMARRHVANIPPDTIVASNNPWIISYATKHPAALLPKNLGKHRLQKFVNNYRIGAIVNLHNTTEKTNEGHDQITRTPHSSETSRLRPERI